MSDIENQNPSTNANGKRVNALELGPRKKSSKSDPLVHHGRHFCRTIHAMCNIHALLTQSVIRVADQTPDDDLTANERREHKVWKELLKTVPNLEEQIMTGSVETMTEIADLLRKGASGARGDDTKALKGNILEWITPKGQALNPPLYRNQKIDRGFNHEQTGALLCPVDLDWSDACQAAVRRGHCYRRSMAYISLRGLQV